MRAQGDIAIIPVKALPEGSRKVEAVNGRYVIAEGEATGHNHTITATPGVELYERDGVLYCVCTDPVDMVHQEHGTQVIEKGVTRLVRQRTWTSGSVKRVVD